MEDYFLNRTLSADLSKKVRKEANFRILIRHGRLSLLDNIKLKLSASSG